MSNLMFIETRFFSFILLHANDSPDCEIIFLKSYNTHVLIATFTLKYNILNFRKTLLKREEDKLISLMNSE